VVRARAHTHTHTHTHNLHMYQSGMFQTGNVPRMAPDLITPTFLERFVSCKGYIITQPHYCSTMVLITPTLSARIVLSCILLEQYVKDITCKEHVLGYSCIERIWCRMSIYREHILDIGSLYIDILHHILSIHEYPRTSSLYMIS
jgi:hypothetical protein